MSYNKRRPRKGKLLKSVWARKNLQAGILKKTNSKSINPECLDLHASSKDLHSMAVGNNELFLPEGKIPENYLLVLLLEFVQDRLLKILTLPLIMLKNGQAYFNNLPEWTTQDF